MQGARGAEVSGSGRRRRWLPGGSPHSCGGLSASSYLTWQTPLPGGALGRSPSSGSGRVSPVVGYVAGPAPSPRYR